MNEERIGNYPFNTEIRSAGGLTIGTNFEFAADIPASPGHSVRLSQTADNFSISLGDGNIASLAFSFLRQPEAELQNAIKHQDLFGGDNLSPQIPTTESVPAFDATQPLSFCKYKEHLIMYAGDNAVMGIPLSNQGKLATQDLPTRREIKKLSDPLSATVGSTKYLGAKEISSGGDVILGDVNVSGDFVGGETRVFGGQYSGSKFDINPKTIQGAKVHYQESIVGPSGNTEASLNPVTKSFKAEGALIIQQPLDQITDEFIQNSGASNLDRAALAKLRELNIVAGNNGIFSMIEDKTGNAYCVYIDAPGVAHVLEFANNRFTRVISQTTLPSEALADLMKPDLQISHVPGKRLSITSGRSSLKIMPTVAILKVNGDPLYFD